MDGLDVIDQTTDTDLDVSTVDDQQAETVDQDKEQQAVADTDKVDGRKFPTEWSRQIKELRETRPELADMLTKLRDTYGRYGAVSELAPKGVEDIRQWKTTIDAVGGPEAAADLMQRAATMDQVDAKIEAGDFSVIGELPESLQKGFYQMLPDALSDLQTKDPQAFEAAVAPHFKAALLGTGMDEHLKKMYAAAGENEPLKELIKAQYDWFQQQTNGAGKMQPGAKSADPHTQRLQKQLDTYQEGERKQFVDSVLGTRDKAIEDSFKEHVAVYTKQLGLSDAQVGDLKDSFAAKVKAGQVEGTPFFKQLKAYSALKNRDMSIVDNYIKSSTTQDAKSIIDGLVTARYGGMRAKPKTIEPGTKTTDSGAVRVAQAPGQDQWDMSKMESMGYEATVKKGLFYLTGGRTVQLVRQ